MQTWVYPNRVWFTQFNYVANGIQQKEKARTLLNYFVKSPWAVEGE